MVDDWKIGVNLCDGKSVEREKVAENITNFMLLTSSRGLKEKIKKVTETLHKAVEKLQDHPTLIWIDSSWI